jgi:hypothetical protein
MTYKMDFILIIIYIIIIKILKKKHRAIKEQTRVYAVSDTTFTQFFYFYLIDGPFKGGGGRGGEERKVH